MIQFPRIQDARGNLSFAERLPFEIKRCYWLYGIEPQATRGGHSHKTLERILIAVAGSFRAIVNEDERILFNPWEGLYVPPMAWLDLDSFSGGAVCMVLASAEYDEADYIREKSAWIMQKS
jgi:uncharacterized RmlC-like cupin family protein